MNGDRDRLEQVALNLLANAVKFTPPGGRVLLRVAASRDGCELCVEDSGPGIGRRRLRDLFDGVAPRDGAPTPRQSGLGLGLPIVHALVTLHGGVVAAGISPLGGARFIARFPAGVPERGPSAPTPVGGFGIAPPRAWIDDGAQPL